MTRLEDAGGDGLVEGVVRWPQDLEENMERREVVFFSLLICALERNRSGYLYNGMGILCLTEV